MYSDPEPTLAGLLLGLRPHGPAGRGGGHLDAAPVAVADVSVTGSHPPHESAQPPHEALTPVTPDALPGVLPRVDGGWWRDVTQRREQALQQLQRAGRASEARDALQAVVVRALDAVAPLPTPAAQAMLRLLCALVPAVLTGDPEARRLADLVARGWLPVGRVDGRLVVTTNARADATTSRPWAGAVVGELAA